MQAVNIHEAKTHLSRLVEQAAQDEEIIIAKAGRPVARRVPLETAQRPRRRGVLKSKLVVPEDFDAPLPGETLRAFGIEP